MSLFGYYARVLCVIKKLNMFIDIEKKVVYNKLKNYKEVFGMDFKVGDFVKHKLTGEKCLIIRKGREQFLIRTPDYKEVGAYAAELENA